MEKKPSQPIRLLAFDLDGTLLNSKKELTARTRAALLAAAQAGVLLVPTTGRFYKAMPEAVHALPLQYAIAINGAQIYDIAAARTLRSAEFPAHTALDLMEYLDGFAVIYDCYLDGWGWMTRTMKQRAADYIPNAYALRMVQTLRTDVDDLKTSVRERNCGVQKVQLFTADEPLRLKLLEDLTARFPGLCVCSSLPFNVEITDARANKGEAVAALAAHLGIAPEAVMAIGDGLNDVSLLQTAGWSVAMENACEPLLKIADVQTASCDDEGAALAIERYCLPGGGQDG